MMLCHLNMAGILPGSLRIVLVEQSSQLNSCPKDGFPSICHKEIHDLTASLLTEVCRN